MSDSARLEEFAAAFRARFGERFVLLDVDEVDEMRLLGREPMSDVSRSRVGRFLSQSIAPAMLLYGPPRWHNHERTFRGWHGGLSPDEMRVPLVVA